MRPLSAALAVCTLAGLAGCSSPVRLLTVTSVTPTTLSAGSTGTVLTLTGTQFTSAMTVLLGATALPTTFGSSTTLTATVPASVAGGSYVVSLRDNGNVYAAASVLATTLTVQITNPAPTLTGATPTVLVAGASSAAVAATGTNFVSGTTASVDGYSRAVTVTDGTHLTVALTADDLLYATTRQLTVTNPAPGGGTSAATALTITDDTRAATKYAAYGDSITYGYGVAYPALPYAYLLAAANNLTLADHGATGDQACDTLPKRLYPTGDEYLSRPGQMYTYMIGTNETYVKGAGAYEAVYNTCAQAVLSWLALPRANKLVAGDNGLAVSGGCGATPDTTRSGALFCATAGAVTTALQTFGSPIYLWYYVDDSAPAAATLQISIDGGAATSYPTQLTPAISTLNGSTASIALARLPVPAGTHTVTMTAPNGNAGVLGVGTVPKSRSTLSFLVSGDVPFQAVSSPKAPASVQVQYAADARANVALLQSDGLDLRFAPTRLYMLGTAAEMSDALHPNALGHVHLQTAFQTGFTNLNATGGPYAAAVRRPGVVLDHGWENLLPELAMVTVQPGREGAAYRLAAGAGDLVTVSNVSAGGHAAILLAPAGEAIEGAAGGVTLPAGEVVTLSRGEHGAWTVVRATRTGGALTAEQP